MRPRALGAAALTALLAAGEETTERTVTRRIVDTRFGQVHVRTTQGAGPPLLLLHMSPVSGWMFERFLHTMGRERTLIAPDRLGFGSSDPPPRALSMEEFARSTLDVLDVLDHERVDVLGVHTGAVEAAALAHLAPARVRRLGMVAVPVFTAEEVPKLRAAFAGPPDPPAEDGSHLMPVWKRRFAYREPPYDLPLMHARFVQELLAGANKTIAYEAVFAYPLGERLGSLAPPLVVFAPHDDLIEQTERARGLLPPGATYVDLPDLQLDAFERFPERMADLVRRHFPAGPDRTP